MTMIGFGKNDRAIGGSKDLESYKGESKRTDLISFCWFFEDENGNPKMTLDDTPKFISKEYYYIQGLGYVVANDYLREKLGEPPKRRIGTFVVHYCTDKSGNLQKPFEYEVKPWSFGEAKFSQLREINRDHQLTHHDLRVMCEEEKFQKMNFFPTKNAAIWQQKDAIREEVLNTVKSLENSFTVARDVPLEKLKEHFGDNVEAVPPLATSDVDFEDILDSLE
jgi:hypothetical protein